MKGNGHTLGRETFIESGELMKGNKRTLQPACIAP